MKNTCSQQITIAWRPSLDALKEQLVLVRVLSFYSLEISFSNNLCRKITKLVEFVTFTKKAKQQF